MNVSAYRQVGAVGAQDVLAYILEILRHQLYIHFRFKFTVVDICLRKVGKIEAQRQYKGQKDYGQVYRQGYIWLVVVVDIVRSDLSANNDRQAAALTSHTSFKQCSLKSDMGINESQRP